jgi:hypothetical protein
VSKKKRHHGGRQSASSPRRARRRDFLDDLADAVADGDLVRSLSIMSAVVETLTVRVGDDDESDDREPGDDSAVRELAHSLFERDDAVANAMLATLAPFVEPDLRALIRIDLARRGAGAVPSWLLDIENCEFTNACSMTDWFGDADEIAFGFRWEAGQACTAVVVVDHNAGMVATDAVVLPTTVNDVVQRTRRDAERTEDDLFVTDLSAADVRARVQESVLIGQFVGPFESESWPAMRPFVEWLVAKLPEGGARYEWASLPDDGGRALRARFLASPAAATVRGSESIERHVDDIVRVAFEHGGGDPLRWSPARVVTLLCEAYPESVPPGADADAVPEVLRAFVRFAHAERGVPSGLTDETVEAIDACEPVFRDVMESVAREGGSETPP